MTAVAGRSAGYVLDGSCQCATRVILDVAGSTLPRRSLENFIQVAGLTTHRLMRTSQLKSSTRMVESEAWLLRMNDINTNGQRQQHHARNPAAQPNHGRIQDIHANEARTEGQGQTRVLRRRLLSPARQVCKPEQTRISTKRRHSARHAHSSSPLLRSRKFVSSFVTTNVLFL